MIAHVGRVAQGLARGQELFMHLFVQATGEKTKTYKQHPQQIQGRFSVVAPKFVSLVSNLASES